MSAVWQKLGEALIECDKLKEEAVRNQDFPLACKYRDMGERIRRLQKDDQTDPDRSPQVFLTSEEARERLRNPPKGKRMNFRDMPREVMVELLTKIRNSLIGCEDAGDAVLYVSEKLGVDQDTNAKNESEPE